MKRISMEKTVLAGYKGRIKHGSHLINVEVVTVMTAKLADDLGIKSVIFDRDALPKQFHKVELDTELRGIRARFTIKGLEQFELAFDPDMLTKFICQRKGDGKKKAKILALKFQAHYRGNIHDLIDTFERLGSGEGVLTLDPLQESLPFPEPEKKGKQAHPIYRH